MSVGSFCERNVVTIRPQDDLSIAGRLMREKHVGYLIAVDALSKNANVPVGVITDRDIVVAVVAAEVSPRSLCVEDVMTVNPLVIDESLELSATLQRMRERGVRRAPVVDAKGGLCGVISLDDVLEELAEQLANIAGSIRNEQNIERLHRN